MNNLHKARINAYLMLCLRKSKAPHIYNYLNIKSPAPISPCNRFTSKLKHTGDRLPHHTGAPSGSPVFSIAAAGALRGYAFGSLDAGEGGTVGF